MNVKVLDEVKALVLLGSPIMITQVAQMGMTVIDLLMAGRVSAIDLAGVAIGSNLYWPTTLLATGTLFAVTPTVAQLYGARRLDEIGPVARQAGWIALLGAVVVISILFQAEAIFNFLKVDPVAIPVAVGFLHAQSLGIVALFGYYVLRNLCDGMALTTLAMATAITMILLKIPLNYVFVFGAFGMPGYGGIGCGMATAIIFWVQMLVMVAAILATRIRLSGVFNRFDWPDFAVIWRLMRLGVPIGMSIFAEVAFFSAIALLIGQLGVENIASHQVAMNIAGITFMVPLGFSMASAIRIGNNIGATDYSGARRTAHVAAACALMFAITVAVIYIIARRDIVSLYTDDANVIALSSTLLLYCAMFQLFDCTQVTLMGSLRGYKDTSVPMFIAVFSYWMVGMPIGASLAFGWFGIEPFGVTGFWWGLSIGLAVASICLGTRLGWFAHHFEHDQRFRQVRLALR